MNVQRLKFAWARGARLQVPVLEWGTDKQIAWATEDMPDHLTWPIARIHSDDEHLQYGPVSTAFRDMALYLDNIELPEEVEVFMDLAGSNYPMSAWSSDEIEINFCRLMFAEYLADQGA